MGDGLDESLERRSLEEKSSGALVLADFPESQDAGSEAVGPLHGAGLAGEVSGAGRGCGLVGGLLRSPNQSLL